VGIGGLLAYGEQFVSGWLGVGVDGEGAEVQVGCEEESAEEKRGGTTCADEG
jgi:hypothetical protein